MLIIIFSSACVIHKDLFFIIQNLTCSLQEEEEILVPTDPATGNVDFIECESPLDLVQYILAKEKTKGLPVDKLCQAISVQTGVSWNKRFKNKHGTIAKVSVAKFWLEVRTFDQENCSLNDCRNSCARGTESRYRLSIVLFMFKS